MRYYVIAGEASGDLHGSNLVRELRALDPAAEIRGWGGDLMMAAGVTIVKHYRDLAFMGFVEVAANIRTILKNMRFCKEDILGYAPDVVIFIDYPGFNIPIAEFAKSKGFRTVYYISPQVWAWKESRVKKLKKSIDRMLVILPFEKEFYRKWDYEVEYVGHPLVETIERSKKHIAEKRAASMRQEMEERTSKPLVALLPGSRQQEVKKKLPVMLEVTRHFPECRFVVAQASALPDTFIRTFTDSFPNVEIMKGDTYCLLSMADAALVTSGTATLETALFGVPEVVCYKGSPVSYLIAKRLVKVRYISLVNLIMGREVVKELIQDEMNPGNLQRELAKLLQDDDTKARMAKDYRELRELLGKGGDASAKAAASVMRLLGKEGKAAG
jgi:lipid-A-disaccharide synthase